VVWSADGVIVTNNHVVAGAASLQVAFADGQRVSAELIATDPLADLAVIRADRDGLPAATFAPSLPRVGELALAIGNPIGFEDSVTQGIISGLHRAIPGAAQRAPSLVDLIQTDAAISPGNSGGALVNERGEVVGVNVAYIPPNSVGAVSIGFAIPSPTVINIVQQLLESGVAVHPYTGIRPVTLTPQLAQRFNLKADHGVVVLAVESGGPAEAAGITPGDVITEIDGKRIDTAEDLLAAVAEHAPGDAVSVTLLRDGQEKSVTLILGEFPVSG
jgi:S1-C subfamily serine protease